MHCHPFFFSFSCASDSTLIYVGLGQKLHKWIYLCRVKIYICKQLGKCSVGEIIFTFPWEELRSKCIFVSAGIYLALPMGALKLKMYGLCNKQRWRTTVWARSLILKASNNLVCLYWRISCSPVTWATLRESCLENNMAGEGGRRNAVFPKCLCRDFLPRTEDGMLLEELISVRVHLLWTSDKDYCSVLKPSSFISWFIF